MSPRDEWILKEYQPPNSLERWFFRKNVAPAVTPKHHDYGFIAFLTFHYHPRDESGLPSVEDNEAFAKFEETQLEALESHGLSVYVAAVIKSGVKDFLFYTRDPHLFLQKTEPFRAVYPQFRVSCQLAPDPQWAQYEDFP